ncbi:MAG TPA: MBL fold metallo-hydrolase [Bacillales bacterium]
MENNINHSMEDAMDNKYIPMTSVMSGVGQTVTEDIYCYTVQIVNICFVGNPQKSNEWVLVDAGMPESANRIIHSAEEHFGEGRRPEAIVLTHGHFDHVGAVVDLMEEWDVPVYAHELEMPFLTGESDYPEPDGSVEGGLVAKMSPLFPNESVNLGNHVKVLPADGSIPGMPGWRWLHTPGHSPGHVSFFRDSDRSLIAGDAFITVKQESLLKVLTQDQQVSGPPRYLTTDWQAAWDSVKKLGDLKPKVAVTGHGRPMFGEELSTGLDKLVREFGEIAIPDHGRYVGRKH